MNYFAKLPLSLLFSFVLACSHVVASEPPAPAEDVRLGGLWGEAQARAAHRMAMPPLDKSDFILADVSLKQKRIFTDYSGDISGRWISVAAFLTPLYPEPFATFPKILTEISTCQKRDGHFGADQDLPRIEHDRDKAILWGNGRLLIGLVEAYEQTGDKKALETAKRLGDYFIYNQYPNGGAGLRTFHLIDGQPVAFKDSGHEAWWCCSMHWLRATVDVARFALSGGVQGPSINLMIDCAGSVAGPDGKWEIALREIEDGLHITLQSPAETKATLRIHRPAWAGDGVRIEKPAALSLRETKNAWLVDGFWKGTQEIVVHLPTALRSEKAPGDAGALLRGHDLMVAHRVPANAWLMDLLPGTRPVVVWTAATDAKNGTVLVPASLDADADPKRPEQWKQLELAPLRAVAGQPHDAAWFSFQLRTAKSE